MSVNSERMHDRTLKNPTNYKDQNVAASDKRIVEPKTSGEAIDTKAENSSSEEKVQISFKKNVKKIIKTIPKKLKTFKDSFSPHLVAVEHQEIYTRKDEASIEKTINLNHKPKALEPIPDITRKIGDDTNKEPITKIDADVKEQLDTKPKQKKQAPPVPQVAINKMPSEHTEDEIKTMMNAKCQKRRPSYNTQNSIDKTPSVVVKASNQNKIVDDKQVAQSTSLEKEHVILLEDKALYKTELKVNILPLEPGKIEKANANVEISKNDELFQSLSAFVAPTKPSVEEVEKMEVDSPEIEEAKEAMPTEGQAVHLDTNSNLINSNEHLENLDAILKNLENLACPNVDEETKPEQNAAKEEKGSPHRQYFTDGLPPEPVQPVIQDMEVYTADCLKKLEDISEQVTAVNSQIELELNDDEYCECVEKLQKLAVGVDKVIAKGIQAIKDAKKKQLRRIHALEDQLDEKYDS